MSGFWVLLKKELLEQLRTYKLLIVGGVFLFFGLSTPLMIKYMPELIKLAGGTGGMVIEMPPPTAVQAMVEYVSTMTQFGVLIAILVAMGAIAKEREVGTAAMVLSKPVGQPAFILAKLKAHTLIFLMAIILGGIACWGYTYMLFGEAPVMGFVGQNLLLALLFALSVAVTLLFSSIFKSQLAAGGLALAVLIVQAMSSSLPWVGKYLPGQLVNWGNNLLYGKPQEGGWIVLIVCALTIGLCFYLTVISLRRKEL
jgi:ABC-2 type transport system permease protein